MTVWFDDDRQRWRYDFQVAGVRHARECLDAAGKPVTSRRSALEAEAEAKRLAKIGPKLPKASDLTLAEVINALSDTWLTENEKNSKHRCARELLAYAGPAMPIRDMDGAWVQDYTMHLLNQPVRVWTGGPRRDPGDPALARFWRPEKSGRMRTNRAVNVHLPLLRQIFQRAYLTRDPITRERAIDEIPAVKDLPEPKRKARPVPDDVLAELRTILPAHICEAMVATLYFGFRRSEAFNLQIHHIDFFARGVRLEHTEVKNDEDSFLPGSRAAMKFMAILVDQAKARGTTYLFTWQRTYKDQKRQSAAPWMNIKTPTRAWKTAMKKVLSKFNKKYRWHDIRAAFITDVAINSGGIIAQKLARHADFDTTKAYIDVAEEALRDAAERVGMRSALGLISGGKK